MFGALCEWMVLGQVFLTAVIAITEHVTKEPFFGGNDSKELIPLVTYLLLPLLWIAWPITVIILVLALYYDMDERKRTRA